MSVCYAPRLSLSSMLTSFTMMVGGDIWLMRNPLQGRHRGSKYRPVADDHHLPVSMGRFKLKQNSSEMG